MNSPTELASKSITMPSWLLAVLLCGGLGGASSGVMGVVGLGGSPDTSATEAEGRMVRVEDDVQDLGVAVEKMQSELSIVHDNQIAICIATDAQCER